MSELRISCPECQAQYRLKAEPKPNATLRCAKCGASFSWSKAASRPKPAQPQPQPVYAMQAAPAPKTNWGLYASLGAVATLLVVCSVLATVIILQRREPAGLGPVAQAQAAEPASAQAPAAAPPLATPETSEASGVKQDVTAPPTPAANSSKAATAAEAPPAPSNPPPATAEETAPASSAAAVAADASADPPEAEPIAEVAAAPAAAAPAPPAVNLAGPPRYQWRKGDVLAYKFEIVADLGDEFDKVSGTCQLDISPWDEPKPQPKVAVDLPEELEGPQYSGSAFVVHPDGYLATCAHVVNGAKTVTLNLNDHEYQAEVVAVNQEDDLALLKVKARNLKWLPLADSDKVQLGEEVRVLGYPLTDLLGSNLKVSQGIISGVVMEGGSKRFQIDASVNPGNSGGPVMNGRGEVVGMAASMLASAELSKLAFAVPSGSIRKMLAAQQAAQANAAPAAAPVDGPALVSRASKSMALVHVRGAVNNVGEGELVKFHYNVHSERSSKQADNRFGMPRIPSIQNGLPFRIGDGQMRFDARGELLESEGETDLPYTVGCLPSLMIEPLDANGQNFWSEEGQVTLATETSPFGMHSRLFQPPRGLGMPPGFPGSQQVREAKFRRGYRIVERKGNLIIIEKTYAFRTLDDEDAPYLSIEGKGRLTFDQQRGCVTAMDYKQTAKRNIDNVSVSIPMRVSFSQLSPKDFVAEQLPLAIRQAKRDLQTQRTEQDAAGLSGEELIDDLLRRISRQMASGERSLTTEISQLGDVDVVPSRRSQVCKLLLQIVASDEFSGGFVAMQTLEKWADASCAPALLKLLESSDHLTSAGAARILGNLGEPSAAKPLANALAGGGIMAHDAAQALKKLGPAAEEAVIGLLDNSDEHVRRQACEVLGEVGTARSVKALQAIVDAASGNQFSLESHNAERAIAEIRRRGSSAAALAEIGAIPNRRRRVSAPGGSLKSAAEVLADRSARSNERHNALRLISETAPPDEATRKSVAALLAKSLSASEDSHSRSYALKALAKWGGPEHEAKLLAMLREDDDAPQVEIFTALGRVGGERTAAVLMEQLKKRLNIGSLAPAIAQALGMAASKPGAAQEAVFELLKSNDIVLRAMAAKAISEMDGAKAEAALEKLLATESTNMALVEAINGAARHRLAK